MQSATISPEHAFGDLEPYRRELTAYCYRMPGSPFHAEDGVQDPFLREVLDWQASEVAELLGSSVASGNSALQRARATLANNSAGGTGTAKPLSRQDRALLERYVSAFERYDITALTSLIREDATQSMPPYDMWLSGREDIFKWWFGPGIGCQGSRVRAIESANGMPTFAQWKPSPNGGYDAWAIQVLELSDGRIGEFTFFLDTARLFPLFGLPLHLDA